MADAYCLQMLLQQTSDVQDAIAKIVSGVTLLVDTSVVITAMSEHLRPRAQQRMSNLLRAARLLGCRLVTGEDVLNEIDTHLDRIRYNYAMFNLPGQATSPFREITAPLLEQAYEEARQKKLYGGGFNDFIDLFKGRDTPQEDLAEYIRTELGIEYLDLTSEIKALSHSEIGDLFHEWKDRKYRRPWVDDRAFETLVMHDVRAFLLVEKRREEQRGAPSYSHKWWWLAIDSSALYFDRQRHGRGVGSRVCMSPDFFGRYLSLASKPGSGHHADAMIPPAALRIASLGLVPNEIRKEAQRAYEALGGQPEYLRRRRLRELMNRAMATTVEDVDDTEESGESQEDAATKNESR